MAKELRHRKVSYFNPIIALVWLFKCELSELMADMLLRFHASHTVTVGAGRSVLPFVANMAYLQIFKNHPYYWSQNA